MAEQDEAKAAAYAEFIREKAMVDEIIAKIMEEEKQEALAKMQKRKETMEYIHKCALPSPLSSFLILLPLLVVMLVALVLSLLWVTSLLSWWTWWWWGWGFLEVALVVVMAM
eukprot:3314024-Rhodomonas_salina.1